MANMKEILIEAISFVLVHRYGPLDQATCQRILMEFDAKNFLISGEIDDVATTAASKKDLANESVFSRLMGFLRHAAGQFWEDRRGQILSTSSGSLLRQRTIFFPHSSEVF